MSNPAPAAAAVNAVAVKLPAFWPQKPCSWFIPVEAQFRRANITQEQTKLDHVLAVLDPETCDRISSLSLSPWQSMWQLFDLPACC